MKRWLAALLFLAALAAPSRSQFIGYTSPQTVSQRFTNQTCTGVAQDFNINNLGQTTHFGQFTSVSANTSAVYFLGSFDGVNFQIFSDISNGIVSSVAAAGYYPVVRLEVVCTVGATFTLSYSGTSTILPSYQGVNLKGLINKILFNQSAAGSNAQIVAQQTPFGNSSGVLTFAYSGGAGPSGSTVSLNCSDGNVISQTFGPFTIANLTAPNVFPIPAGPCIAFNLTYNAGGASANTFTLNYDFNQAGLTTSTGSYTHVTTTTATAAKATNGFLHTLTVNTGGAGTLSIFDLGTAACTGTPATNVVAVITATATTLQTFTYDVNMNQGICVKSSVAMDYTVSSN
jgi:hypothetical protein